MANTDKNIDVGIRVATSLNRSTDKNINSSVDSYATLNKSLNIVKEILSNISANSLFYRKEINKKINTATNISSIINRQITKEISTTGVYIDSNLTKYSFISKFFNNLIPKFYQKISDYEENTLLKNFLNTFEFVHDELKNDIIHLKAIIDIDTLEYEYLTYLAYLLGLEFDFNVPENIVRSEIKNAWQFYKYKGTTDGVSSYIRLSTNLQNVITVNTGTMTLDIYVLIEDHIDEILYSRIINSTDKFVPIIWDTIFHRMKVDRETLLSSDCNEEEYSIIISLDDFDSEDDLISENEIREETMDNDSENLSLNLLSLTVDVNDYLLDEWFLTNNFEILND